LKAAAERLVQKESEVRAKVLKEITEKVKAENEAARKRGQMEAKDDPEILRLAKEDAIKKAEMMDIEEQNSEITKLSTDLSKKSKAPEQPKPQQHAQKQEAAAVKKPVQEKHEQKVQ
jgi:hypothetical protein